MIYTDENRGEIQNRLQASQVIDFRGIRYRNITPTDIDGFFERWNESFVFYEMKRRGGEMPYGQELALRNLVDAVAQSGRHAVLMKCLHDMEAPADIVAADCEVEKYWFQGRWVPGGGRTARQVTDSFLAWCDRHPTTLRRRSA